MAKSAMQIDLEASGDLPSSESVSQPEAQSLLVGSGGGSKHSKDGGEKTPVKGKDFAVRSIETNQKTATIKNVPDESEAIRRFKLLHGLGPKITCRAVPA